MDKEYFGKTDGMHFVLNKETKMEAEEFVIDGNSIKQGNRPICLLSTKDRLERELILAVLNATSGDYDKVKKMLSYFNDVNNPE